MLSPIMRQSVSCKYFGMVQHSDKPTIVSTLVISHDNMYSLSHNPADPSLCKHAPAVRQFRQYEQYQYWSYT